MSFFGQSSNQQSSGGFGGFGSNNTSGTGFGQSSNTGFGASTGGGLFGAANNNTSTNTGFGGSTSSPFGGASAFGSNSSSGGGMFGSNTATAGNSSGFGGFGGNTANTGGGLFGGTSKPAFGAQQPSTGGSLFGGGSNAFGSSNAQTTGAFGAAGPSSTALASNVAECQGTGSTPFQAFSEKDTPTGAQTNHFQSITFMQPYKNYTFEELRLADYNQGRRYGNGSGQAGAFGASTGFGGFGGQNTTGGFGNNTQSTGLFGAQTTSASPFGAATTATSGFGATSTSGGLFGAGAAKPSGFGTTTSQPSGGGLFGSTNQTGGFGAQNNTTNTTGGFGGNQGGGLFGTNNNQQKSGFSFGQNNNTSTGTGFGTSGNTGFGASNNTSTGGGLFGNSTTNAPFGSGQQQQPASNPFGGFGGNQQNQTQPQNTAAPAFGGFGNTNNQQQKPGGLFGGTDNSTSNTGGGLFGANQNNQQSTTGGGLFGNANNNQTGGSSLFAPKPAATGTGLFGNSSTTGNTGGGLFGNNTNQNQQNQSGGLFNTGNQQQAKPGGLFGNNTGSSMFGNSQNNQNNQQQGSSIFGGGLGSTNQQQQSGGLFGNSNNNNTSSMFNNSQQQQQPQNNPLQAPQAYNASIFDPNPYGNRSIFDGLPPPPQQYTGPIATPIGQKGQLKKPAILPQYRINPHVASRFVTPQKRQGYGFSYSTYGTPSSVSSNVSTPGGLGSSSLLHGSISRSLGKSLSSNNLRRSFDTEGESLLSPGAFSAGSSRYNGTGSLKKLTIDRSLRTDLFSAPPPLPASERSDQNRQPGILKKKVSFDASTVGGNGDGQNGAQMNGINGAAETNAESNKSPTPEQGSSAPAQPNGYQNGPSNEDSPPQRDMEQVKGNELAVINEDGDHDMQVSDGSRKTSQPSQRDPQPGAYYMKPSIEEVAKMSFEQKRRVPDVCIGRENCGFVVFDRAVNLNEVPMDRIFGDIAQISHRSLTVYPDALSKPTVGKGLNVPSTIHLANSWPRAKDRKTPLYEKSGERFNKHVQRLRKVRDTEFVRYVADTGTWVFKVKHFTTYGLDYEDEGSEGDTFQTSTLSAPPDSPTPQSRLPRAGSTPMPTGHLQDSSMFSSEWSQNSSSPEDTFEFRRKRLLPGAFDDAAGFEEDREQNHHSEMTETNGNDESFLDERSAASVYDDGAPSDRSSTNHLNGNQSLVVGEEQRDMAGSFPNVDGPSDQENTAGKSILIDSQAADFFGTPAKLDFNQDGDWAEELRRTISPRKQDRQALRESQARVLQHKDRKDESTPKASTKQKAVQPGFATAMDLMRSLNPQEPERKKGKQGAVGQAKAFQV
ncbi:MAG: hypothetical protein Q9168_007607 [Polycauliona sp. 1 TL-2023]